MKKLLLVILLCAATSSAQYVSILGSDYPKVSRPIINAKPAMRSGAGVPSANCTTSLDLYLNTTNGDMYICSATNVWTKVTGSAGTWGSITGTLSSQTDLNTALGLKAPVASPTFTGTATGTFSGALTGNASTATALAANGANCSAGSYPLGVDAGGAAEGCTVAGGSAAFSAITGSTNTTAAMIVGAGATLGYTSTGTIDASHLGGSAAALYAKLASPTFSGTLTIGTTVLDSTGIAIAGCAVGTVIYADGTGCTPVSGAFSGITSGSNTSAAMVVGAGASLGYTSTGTNDASHLGGSAAALYAKLAANTFSGVQTHPLGTAGAPSIVPTGDATSGIFWVTATNLSISVGSTERFRFGSSGIFSNTGGINIGSVAVPDLGIYRNAANVAEFTQGVPGRFADLKLRHIVGGAVATYAPAPTITSGFGTTPSIAGSDMAGRVTVGTGGTDLTGVITFGTAWATAPSCQATDETTTLHVKATATTTTLTLTSASAWTVADKLTWICIGM